MLTTATRGQHLTKNICKQAEALKGNWSSCSASLWDDITKVRCWSVISHSSWFCDGSVLFSLCTLWHQVFISASQHLTRLRHFLRPLTPLDPSEEKLSFSTGKRWRRATEDEITVCRLWNKRDKYGCGRIASPSDDLLLPWWPGGGVCVSTVNNIVFFYSAFIYICLKCVYNKRWFQISCWKRSIITSWFLKSGQIKPDLKQRCRINRCCQSS